MPRKNKAVLLGNEAIALGLVQGGCQVVTGYPGTPSSEILPAAMKWAETWKLPIYAEWSTNEKVAFDQAYAAAMVGKRAACCMKQVGLNVACDSLMSSAYTGVQGGFLVISCDDPGPHSSQTEQDSRRMAWTAKVPVLDPCSPEEARRLALEGLRISERFSIPVMLRSVTRLSHGRQDLEVGAPPSGSSLPQASFTRDPARWAATPRYRFELHKLLNTKLKRIRLVAERLSVAHYPDGAKGPFPLGILAGGIPGLTAVEILEEEALEGIPVLRVRMPFPFPFVKVHEFAQACENLLVLEETDSFLELQLAGRPNVMGRNTGHVPSEGELLPEIIWDVIQRAIGEARGGSSPRPRPSRTRRLLREALEEASLPARRPTLCAGCPHRASFYSIRRAFPKAVYPSDIGCYTLGANQGGVDTVLDMGAGITIASGLYQAFRLDGKQRPILATMGDSTFYHSGTAALINAVHNRARFVLVLLDNQVTAMTGMQSTPAWEHRADGSPGTPIPLERVVAGCGVDFIEVCDPYQVKPMMETLKRAWEHANSQDGGVAVVIARHPCVLHRAQSSPGRGRVPVVTDRCKGCTHCLEAFGCPALYWDEESSRVKVLESACVGCGVCLSVCTRRAIEVKEEVLP